jgi:hypothetical protein
MSTPATHPVLRAFSLVLEAETAACAVAAVLALAAGSIAWAATFAILAAVAFELSVHSQ